MKKSEPKKNAREIPIGGMITDSGSSLKTHTGSWQTFQPKRDSSKCINCGLCFVYCPEDCIAYKEGKISDANMTYCKGCGICAKVCPVKCIKMVEVCNIGKKD
ncbi:4Fe-4S binding protein [Candidatus Woesearchaeota archaeon]|nr:4Fe-4S binding protein [Candidatus Woesearchaeota archaeon]